MGQPTHLEDNIVIGEEIMFMLLADTIVFDDS
jgi:hypothetical protein